MNKQLDTTFTVEPGERAVIATISTTSVDRDGDVILPQGLRLDNFWKNATVLFNHDIRRLPVGKIPRGGIRKMSVAVEAKVVLHRRPPSLHESNEWVPDTLLDLFQMGAPLGFSVGFKPIEVRSATLKDRNRFGRDAVQVVTDWELLELSIVPVPANQDALLMAVSKCARPVGAYTMGALGLRPKAKVTILPPRPRRLKIDGYLPGERLRV